MEHDVGTFLRSRRARLQPRDVGLPDFGRRRVPGLRREELAQLAGVSFDYYVRLEQGRGSHVSDSVLVAVAAALRLSDGERDHLRLLARPPSDVRAEDDARQEVGSTLQRLLRTMEGVPALVLGRRTDVLAWNDLANAVLGFSVLEPDQRNSARFTFTHPEAHRLYPDWPTIAADTVAYLALEAGRHPGDPRLARLVGELSITSRTFRELWARHDILEQGQGAKRVSHRIAGELDFDYQTLMVPDDPDQLLVTLVPRPGTATPERLRLLANWGPPVQEPTDGDAPHPSVDAPGSRRRP